MSGIRLRKGLHDTSKTGYIMNIGLKEAGSGLMFLESTVLATCRKDLKSGLGVASICCVELSKDT